MVVRKRDKALKRVTLTLDPDGYDVIDKLANRGRIAPSPLEGGKE